ncbi:hypothetical protein [Actinoalloteichus spitiensis]|uniref:hypothetical protein n=1 Tax=Actinoalloteichus spitiensis TaxID=252394 RepID=UPI0003805922|nr:hypothetical protein [Actinoalloteichus spitiensis]
MVSSLLLAACGTDTPPRSDERDFPLAATRLTIDTGNFDLRVGPGTEGTVTVHRTLTGMAAEDGNATWALEGEDLILTARCEGFSPGCGASFEVAVPPDIALTLRAEAGHIGAADLPNDLDIRNTNGTVDLNHVAGEVQVTGVAGAVTGTGLRSPAVRVHSENGGVRLGFAAAPDTVDAVSRHSSVTVTLPRDETYAITATSEHDRADVELPHDPSSPRSVRAANVNGGAVVVRGA